MREWCRVQHPVRRSGSGTRGGCGWNENHAQVSSGEVSGGWLGRERIPREVIGGGKGDTAVDFLYRRALHVCLLVYEPCI